jgi:transposase
MCGLQVKLVVSIRRLRCNNKQCSQKTFNEGVPDMAAAYARRTERLKRALTSLALSVSGEGGKRLSHALQMSTSGDTLLRLLRKIELVQTGSPRIIGVDDWALKRGTRYGTLVVDFERCRPIALLPDRSATTLSAWLREHPTIEIVARDRSPEFARAITEGAPQAMQVADRWHLLKNFREMLERALYHLRTELKSVWTQSAKSGQDWALRPRRLRNPSAVEQAAQTARREKRQQRFEQVRYLAARGLSERSIARYLDLDRVTVRKFTRAASFPEYSPRQLRPSILDPYLNYLEQRFREGITNASQLWRELHAQGYPGGRGQVHRWFQHRRSIQTLPSTPPKTQAASPSFPILPAPRPLAFTLMAEPRTLTADQTTVLAYLQQHELFQQIYTFAQHFAVMLRQRLPEQLDPFLLLCARSTISDFRNFGEGLERDLAAVTAALATSFSNRPTEGHVNRLKFVKRAMYGRASFDLLRIRVLAN